MDENEVKQEENVNTNTTTSKEDKKLNICALLSFIFSLVGLLILGLLLGIAAVVLGIIGINKFDPDTQKCKWMAITGTAVGAVDVVFVLLFASML